jgi:geranylgeranyl diphosphate synthase type II
MSTLTLPKPVPIQGIRPPQDNIPQTLSERLRLRDLVAAYCAEKKPTPPLPVAELRSHAELLALSHGLGNRHIDYLGVLINNELWKEHLASVPFERRLLLMPKCLRVEEKCPAPFDEFGLLCKQCGLCTIQDLQAEAERLGYAVLVAEGSAIVMAIIETGKIDAIVGVSCLSVLEKAFPFMEAAAIPGVAIPLLQDDCANTTVDLDWVWETIHLSAGDRTRRLDLDALRHEVDGWFSIAALSETLGAPAGRTQELAHAWLAKAGKRWRPFLTVCALRACSEVATHASLRGLALAVECFHKASLIHDDIEDQDATRYGEPTLHEEAGVPLALNVGDYLLGEGYRLIAAHAPPETVARMVTVAAEGHRQLSLGQGSELEWMRHPEALSTMEVLAIFKGKTAPAFAVALTIGALLGGAGEEELEAIAAYSEALGIAYQINDDLEDASGGADHDDIERRRPSLLMAVALERVKGAEREEMAAWWRGDAARPTAARVRAILVAHGVETHVRALLASFKERAVQSLRMLDNDSLKGLLRRLMGKIFIEQLTGWCHDESAAGKAAAAKADVAKAAVAKPDAATPAGVAATVA